jgi:tubulin epsilon
MRFEGTMNVDINDIVTNLVPFPRLKYLLSSMAPLYQSADMRFGAKAVDNMFTDAFNKDHHLIRGDSKNSP